VAGVGYPNPDRSHFESMDIWQSADPRREKKDGWIGRGASSLQQGGAVPVMHIGARRLPLALVGGGGGVVSINHRKPYRLELGTSDKAEKKDRRKLIDDLTHAPQADKDSLLSFVQKRQTETYTTLDKLEELLGRNR